jgi:hypothetical protein
LKQASAASTSGAASESTREQFELNITEDQPTPDQVQTVLEYVGKSGIPKIITGAHDEKDALKKYIQNKDSLVRPLVRFHVTGVSSCGLPFLTDNDDRLWTGTMARRFPETMNRRS